MFRIEIEQDDELMDLVALMARHLGATFTEKVTIETNNRRLAFGLAGMVGGVVEGLPDFEDIPGIVVTNELATPETMDGKTLSFVDVAHMGAVESVSAETLAPNTNGKPGEKGFCRFCGDAVPPRYRVCTKKECQSAASREWNRKHKEKKAAAAGNPEAVASAPAEEVEKELPFLAGQTAPMYKVPMPDGLRLMTFQELVAAKKAGTVPEGTRIQALPSGRFYVVLAGDLARAEELPAGEAAGPGAAETR